MKTTSRAQTGSQILAELRAEGHKVRVSHRRKRRHEAVLEEMKRIIGKDRAERDAGVVLLSEISALLPLEQNGGTTYVQILDGNDIVLARGHAECRSDERFDRKLGLAIAAGRARKNLTEDIPF